MGLLVGASNLVRREHVQGTGGGGAPPPPPPPANTLSVVPKTLALANGVAVPNASRYVIDTTGLWASQGGSAPTGTTLTLDGAAPDPIYQQPTPGSPVVTWLLRPNTHTISLGGFYSATLDAEFTFAPYTALQSDSGDNANALFYTGGYVGDPNGPYQNPPPTRGYGLIVDNTPTTVFTVSTPSANSTTINGTGFVSACMNGYYKIAGAGTGGADWYGQIKAVVSSSQLTSTQSIPTQVTNAAMTPLSLTSVVVTVAPGDEGWVLSGGPTADTRWEQNWGDSWAPADGPSNGTDVMSNNDWTKTRCIRWDYCAPSEVTMNEVVQNTALVATIATLNMPASPLSTTTAYTALTITASKSPMGATPASIWLDDGAGHTEQLTTSAALAHNATTLNIASHTPSFAFPNGTSIKLYWTDYRISVGQNHKWPDGVTTNPATGDLTASARVVNIGSTIASNSNVWETQGPAWAVEGRGVGSSPYGLQTAFQPYLWSSQQPTIFIDPITPTPFDVQLCTIFEYRLWPFATGNGLPWIVAPSTITPPRATAWSTTNYVPPIGVPLKADNVTPNPPYGGGFIRKWRFFLSTVIRTITYTNVWACVTEGHAYAVPGNTPIYRNDNSIANPGDGPFNPDSGKIFGPVGKYTQAPLTSGITATQTGSIAVGAFAYQTFRTSGGYVATYDPANPSIWEIIKFNSFSGSNSAGGTIVVPSTGRAQFGTVAVAHAAASLVGGPIDVSVFSPGINASLPATPMSFREWPAKITPSLASAIGPPLT